MPGRSSPRPQRVAERIHQELSKLLLTEVKDPRLSLVSLTRVRVGSDLTVAHANYLLLALDDPESPKGKKARQDAEQGLRSAKPFLKREIARLLGLRAAPELYFHWDSGLEHSRHMEALFTEIAALPPAGPSTSPPKGAQPIEDDAQPVEDDAPPPEEPQEAPQPQEAPAPAPARRWGFAARKLQEEDGE